MLHFVRIFHISGILLVFCLAACVRLPVIHGNQALPENFHQGGQLFVIDSLHSEIRLLVYRDGPLARLGHNHVITGKLAGEIYVAESLASSGFRIEIPVQSLEVDLPGPRSEEGADFASVVSESAREGTRRNMLGAALLDAVQFPEITIQSATLQGSAEQMQVSALILIHGRLQTLHFPAQVQYGKEQIVITSSFSVLQSGLGLQPFSILGGALRVRDAMDIRVRIVAGRNSNG